MHIKDIDLNLLRVFPQLMQDRQVSRAASALGLTQPAVSNALRRMRTMLGDELFLRTPKGMQPTPYAMQLAVPIAEALVTKGVGLGTVLAFMMGVTKRYPLLSAHDVNQTDLILYRARLFSSCRPLARNTSPLQHVLR